ncbi:hypothetical protein HY792_01150 [Candidatus Desantisbacteria bacterium]|nr:hypothetical protein [Candidatus Desantisbacteria bacterium]
MPNLTCLSSLCLCAFVSLCLCAFPLDCFGFSERFVGARPLGMGGAFVAVADDANAMSWNPAGLPMLQQYEFNNVWGKQDNLGKENLYSSLIVPAFNENCALGFGWQNLKYKPISFSRGEWAFACARRAGKWLLGGCGRSIYRSTNRQIPDKEIGITMDTGALWIPCPTLRLGFVKYAMFGTDLQKDEHVRYKMGLCYHPPANETLLFAMDRDNLGSCWGIEFRLRKQILKTDIVLRLGSNSSKGISIKQANVLDANLLQFDYASSGGNSYSSISLGYDYITSLFNLHGISLDPFFSNLYVCTYKSLGNGKIPLGTITVENKMQDVPMDVWVTIDMKEYTDNKAVPLKMELTLEKKEGTKAQRHKGTKGGGEGDRKQEAVGSGTIQAGGTSTLMGTITSKEEGTKAQLNPLPVPLTLGEGERHRGKEAGGSSTIVAQASSPSCLLPTFNRLKEPSVVEKNAAETKEKERLDRCTIPPGYIARIKLINLPLDESILKVKGNVSVSPEIKLYYTLRDEVKETTPKCGNVNICGNNGTGTYQVNWNQHGLLTTFMVIKEDSFMADFMNEVKRCYLKTKESAVFPEGFPENTFKAMYLFDVLKMWGITYAERKDYKIGGSKDAYLRMPDEILGGRFANGNDEDLSVLLAACLKYWDIPIGFLNGGHAKKENFMPIFSTGIPAKDGTLTIGYNDIFLFNPEWDKETTWLPLRIPKWKDNFIVICQQGMEFYRGEEDGKKSKETYSFKSIFLPKESNFTPSIPMKGAGEKGEKKIVFSDKFWAKVYEEFRIDIQKFNELSSYRKFFGEVKVEPIKSEK